jgi:hypothetical protein
MIRITISVEAFKAIAWTLPLGSAGYEAEANQHGERKSFRLPLGAGEATVLFGAG